MLSSCILAFPMVSVSLFLMQYLKASASDISFYYTIVFIPWNFRIIYGSISDRLPVLGLHRRPYLVVCYVALALLQLMYGVFVQSIQSAYAMGVCLSFFFAFSMTVLDAVSVDVVRAFSVDVEVKNTMQKSTDVQSANMTFRTVGTVLGVSISGLLSTQMSPREIIALTGVLPLISAVICILSPIDHSHDGSLMPKKSVSAIARWPIVNVDRVKRVAAAGFFILMYSSVPSTSVAFNSYLYNSLGISGEELYAVSQCSYAGSLIGTILYWISFRKTRDIRTAFAVSLIASLLCASSRLLVLQGWTSIYYICGQEMLISASARLALMPVLVYACKSASLLENLMTEGFLFGLFISFQAWGGTLSGILSGLISSQFDLNIFVYISAGIGIIPLLALNAIKLEREQEVFSDSST